MAEPTSREALLQALGRDYDVVVVGGGITGAGVLDLATRRGYRALLVEAKDFAWGTSSRSGKLVHGGLRYIAQGQVTTSLHAVRERERLLAAYAGLVQPLTFAFPIPLGGLAARLAVGGLLTVYDAMAGRRSRQYHDRKAFAALAPGLTTPGTGGYSFGDGVTDDARLVLRVLDGARRRGGVAIRSMKAVGLVRGGPLGRVRAVALEDAEKGETLEVSARVVINASGVWADELRGHLGRTPRLRKLRGSHLVIRGERLPLERAVGLRSPRDRRSMYVMPWQGVTLLGTTDLDHDQPLDEEPRITPEEGAYLLETVNHWFPEAEIVPSDVIATQAGIRPVVSSGKKDPSKESRDEMVWVDPGLVTISGGKLTTFSMMAARALDAAARFVEPKGGPAPAPAEPEPVSDARLAGRYGGAARDVLALEEEGREGTIEGTPFLWAELRHAARAEQVLHLDDLLLRRTRVGLLLQEGGAAILDRVKDATSADLGWSDERWAAETERYRGIWRESMSPELLD